MSKYSKRLAEDDKAVKAEQITLAEANAKASVEQEISRLTAKAATLKSAFNSALGSTPFNVKEVFRLTAEQEQNSKELAIAKGVLESEFAAD